MSPFDGLGRPVRISAPAGSGRAPAAPPSPTPRRPGVTVFTERALWLVGLLSIGAAGTAFLQARLYQNEQSDAFDHALAARAAPPSAADAPLGFGARPDIALLGRLEIPRLGLSAMVREGVDPETLKVAVGRIPGTARPGEAGNIGLAGHRDSFFRPLRGIRRGDLVRLTTLDRSVSYRVELISVVGPERGDLLASDENHPALTLVTCYPFEWTGPAPQRLIVTARPLS